MGEAALKWDRILEDQEIDENGEDVDGYGDMYIGKKGQRAEREMKEEMGAKKGQKSGTKGKRGYRKREKRELKCKMVV